MVGKSSEGEGGSLWSRRTNRGPSELGDSEVLRKETKRFFVEFERLELLCSSRFPKPVGEETREQLGVLLLDAEMFENAEGEFGRDNDEMLETDDGDVRFGPGRLIPLGTRRR